MMRIDDPLRVTLRVVLLVLGGQAGGSLLWAHLDGRALSAFQSGVLFACLTVAAACELAALMRPVAPPKRTNS